jgi:hypothetical protein
MREWPEFVAGEGYSVDLNNSATGEAVTVRLMEKDEDYRVVIDSVVLGELFDRVVGRVVHALSAHSDALMVSRH